MSRAEQVKLYRTFVKGLVTEAGYLTYPEDASSDELNTIPTRKGNRTRRFGIDYEDNFQLLSLITSSSDFIKEFVWKAVANVATSNFLAVQVGTSVKFFSLEADPISDSLKGFTIDLTAYAAPGASNPQIQGNYAQFSSGEGYLFIVHPYVEPLVVEYTPATDTITVTKIIIQVRDFEGLNDNLANDQEPPTLSIEHHYNLLNQGWSQPSAATAPGGTVPPNLPYYYNPYTGSGRGYNRDGNPLL